MKLIWTKEKIISDARKYKFKVEWLENSPTAYQAAKLRGIFESAARHLTRRPIVRKYNKIKVLKLAKKCKSASGFSEKYPGAYAYAKRHGFWLKLKAAVFKTQGSRYLRQVYIFEFKDRSAYIGLSYNPNYRKTAHLKSTNLVGKKAKKTKFKFIILNGLFSPDKAAALEHKTILQYTKRGYSILNRNVAGGLGAAPIKWTESRVVESTKGFKTRRDWAKKYPGAMNAAIRYGILGKITRILPKFGVDKGTWSQKEDIIKSAKKFKTSYEWKKKYPSAYRSAIRKKILKLCTGHMIRKNPNYKKWSNQKAIINDAQRFIKISDWKESSSGSYAASKRTGCFDRASKHMVRHQKPKGFWKIKKNIFSHARSFKNIRSFEKSFPAAVASARKNGWIHEVKMIVGKAD